MLSECMRNLMTHDGSDFVVIELELLNNAGVKSNLAARCAGGDGWCACADAGATGLDL